MVSNLPGSKSFASLRQHLGNGSEGFGAEGESDELEQIAVTDEREKSLSERVLYWNYEGQEELEKQVEKHVGLKLDEADHKEGVLENTRLAMTSRTAFFNGEFSPVLDFLRLKLKCRLSPARSHHLPSNGTRGSC